MALTNNITTDPSNNGDQEKDGNDEISKITTDGGDGKIAGTSKVLGNKDEEEEILVSSDDEILITKSKAKFLLSSEDEVLVSSSEEDDEEYEVYM